MGRLSSHMNTGPARGQKKRKLADNLRNQSGLGTAIGPTKPRKDRPGNVGQPIDTRGAQRTRSSSPQAKMSSYTLPPGPRGDSPGMRQRDAQRAANMRKPAPYGRYENGAPIPQDVHRKMQAKRRMIAPWRREAQKQA